MYKLILVDDEEEVRKGILNKIEWNKYGFEVAGEAENGIEALEIAEKTTPDVIITDIKMPFMDGLKLAEKLRDKLPATKVIILTGFDEFEYAHKAIKLNIIEYILKPISSKELIEVLEKVRAAMDNEIAKKKDIEMLKDYYKKSLPVLKGKFLSSVITGRLDREEINEKSTVYGINIDGLGFTVALLEIDTKSSRENIMESDELRSEELIKFAVMNIAEEIINRYDFNIIFLHEDHIVIIFNSPDYERDKLYSKMFSILEEIRQSAQVFHKVTITVGVGTWCTDIAAISGSYEGALSALDYRLVLGKNRIICIDDMEPKSIRKLVFDDIKERLLISSIKVGTSSELEQAIESLFKEIGDSQISFKECQIFLLRMLTSIINLASDMNMDMDGIFGTNTNLFVELYNLGDYEEVKNWIYSICMRLRSFVSKGRLDSYRQIVKQAEEYINSNYNDCELTIEKICRYLHISPAYFSTIFKKETKLTFLNYLTHVRMEAARELLRTTNMKAFEIAKKVGYAEPNYFSYCFKKNFGISPSEYRNSR